MMIGDAVERCNRSHRALLATEIWGGEANDLSEGGTGWTSSLAVAKHVTRDDVVGRLRPLLDLPVELMLPAHGEPTDGAAIERVLS